tara:strand:+ start:3130 stop:3702 length:573 start_codon:yes stop_codon:yes gene_type:complete
MRGLLAKAVNLLKRLFFFKAIDESPENILLEVHKKKGLLWEKIEEFRKQIVSLDGSVKHELGEEQESDLSEMCPLQQDLTNGLYTREVFMPKGTLVVSFIHKQDHPSFVLQGEASVLLDDGQIVKYKQGDKIMTKTGTQRVLFMHEDTRWVCVYRTNAKTFLEAEKDVYTNDFRLLPKEFLNKKKLLWQE